MLHAGTSLNKKAHSGLKGRTCPPSSLPPWKTSSRGLVVSWSHTLSISPSLSLSLLPNIPPSPPSPRNTPNKAYKSNTAYFLQLVHLSTYNQGETMGRLATSLSQMAFAAGVVSHLAVMAVCITVLYLLALGTRVVSSMLVRRPG